MLSEKIKDLEKDYADACKEIRKLTIENEGLKQRVKAYKECGAMMIPVKVYTHKARGNTTVKFLDGSSITVKRKKGEKDCIETAIAYCLLKQCLTASELKKLVNEKEEH